MPTNVAITDKGIKRVKMAYIGPPLIANIVVIKMVGVKDNQIIEKKTANIK